MDSLAFNALNTDMEKEPHHDQKGIVIVQNVALLSEHYFNGDSATPPHDIPSATKSLTSLLIGIAIDKQTFYGVNGLISQKSRNSAMHKLPTTISSRLSSNALPVATDCSIPNRC